MSHRPENDSELTARVIAVQSLAASLDRITREKGISGISEVLANITAATREAEWRCNDILREKEKKNGARDGMVQT